MGVLFQLELSQYWPPERTREMQLHQLRLLLGNAVENVPWYRQRRDLYDPDRVDLARDWCEVPVLARADVQEGSAVLLGREFAAGDEKVFKVESSGSTGRPVKVYQNAEVQFFWHVLTLREHFWHRRDPGALLASIKHARAGRNEYPGLRREGWGPAMNMLFPGGPLAALNSSTDIATQVRWLREHRPRYLLTYPSNLRELARYFIAEGLELDSLRQLRCLGETVDDDTRELARQAWGVDVADMYSAQEVGYLALQCPDSPSQYHVQSESVILEVVDEDNRPVAPGETGRVLVTSLHNLAMPLVRYELGDYAVAGGNCSCGRGLPVLERVLGRSRNMLRLPDGSTRWPTFGTHRWSGDLPVKQFQFIQRSLDRIEAKLVVSAPPSAEQERMLIDSLRGRLGSGFRIDLVYVDEIPRSASGKFEDFRCEVE